MDRSAKEKIVAEMNSKLRDIRLAALAEYRGLTVGKMSALRNSLRLSKTELKVVKNTLLRLATHDTTANVLVPYLKGPLAVAINQSDVIEATKALLDFSKKNPGFDIKIAMLDGKLLSKVDLQILSELPSREVLLARLLAAMNGVPSSFVSVLAAVPRSLVQVLVAYRDKKEQHHQ